jgi:hypothetical protein
VIGTESYLSNIYLVLFPTFLGKYALRRLFGCKKTGKTIIAAGAPFRLAGHCPVKLKRSAKPLFTHAL